MYQFFHLPQSSSSSITAGGGTDGYLDLPLLQFSSSSSLSSSDACTTNTSSSSSSIQQDSLLLMQSLRMKVINQENISTHNNNIGFGACLMIMDDNHFLAEWLAYHYYKLPLRRLIVAIDPRSTTLPTEILNRYRHLGLMNITEWQEPDFMPPHLLGLHEQSTSTSTSWEVLKRNYIERQAQFYTKCMAILKHENITWTAIIDTDEYILPNPHADDLHRIPNIDMDHKQSQSKNTKTIYELIHNHRRTNIMFKMGCISMHRLQFGNKESSSNDVQSMVPMGYNGSDFVTLRWRFHAGHDNAPVNKIAKCMVDLSRSNYADFVSTNVNAHRPIKRLCLEKNLRIDHFTSPFCVYHYTGSWEQWNYRKTDFRPKRQEENYFKLNFDKSDNQDDTLRPWLQEFVNIHGTELSNYLLQGAGQLSPTQTQMIG